MARVRDELVRMIDRALGDDARDALIASRQLREELLWLEQRAVVHARAAGFDWGRIGRNLGLTRQGARQKFGKLALMMPPHVRALDRERRQSNDVMRLLHQMEDRRQHPFPDDPVLW